MSTTAWIVLGVFIWAACVIVILALFSSLTTRNRRQDEDAAWLNGFRMPPGDSEPWDWRQ